ncbi:MAG: fatty acid desaturase [Proteobacteria bacterium]|nr:fatty acid desaturase [Pseudomonadota bacterium]
MIEPSLGNALPYFMPLVIFPLLTAAALYGGWWIVGPVVFLGLANPLDSMLGSEERSMNPKKTLESQLLGYKLAVWSWAALWPVALVFSLWQILVAGHLAAWEVAVMALVLAGVAQAIFVVGHELVHRRSVWERRLGELLLSSVSYATYSTEHVYIHHALVGTPADLGSAPKGQSFWHYFPREVKSNLVGSWRFERDRLARRHLPVWHYTNPFWRYGLETALWYALVYWMGGAVAAAVYAILSLGVIFSMKLINYVQHYGLRRVRLPNGRYERIQPRHSWNADYKFTNWFNYNVQRHPDHHGTARRRYPLLQHQDGDASPQLPGNYTQMAGLAVFPKRWFETMDPLVDRWRAHFYPEIDDWSAYDSPAYAARPEAFETIAMILGCAPRFAEWINRNPELLDSLKQQEFTDLDLPDGFGPDSDFEAIARRGLALLYWTREFGVSQMKQQIAEFPVQDAGEAVEAALNWSNEKVFQIGMHTLRGNLSPMEAGTPLSNVAEASIASVLSSVEEEFAERRAAPAGSGVVAVVLGDLASGEMAPGDGLEVVLVYEGGPVDHFEALCRSFRDALRALSRGSLLFSPLSGGREEPAGRSLAEFSEHHRSAGSAAELRSLTRARCVFAAGDPDIGNRFNQARREILAHAAAREDLIAELRAGNPDTSEPQLSSFEVMRGGLEDIERTARLLQLSVAGDAPDSPAPDAVDVFQTARKRGLVSESAAERLAEAARMWRNLRGALRLVGGSGFDPGTASAKTETLIARSCGQEDPEALTRAIREKASSAAAEIDALSA